MVGLHKLPKIKKRSKKRVGRGYGSGKGGHTTGRGHSKGQKARGKVKLGFEGGQLPIHKRLPKKRGFKRAFANEVAVVNVGQLERFSSGEVITPQKLLEAGLVSTIPNGGVKLLGDGEVEKNLTIRGLDYSQSAKKKVEKAGGTVE